MTLGPGGQIVRSIELILYQLHALGAAGVPRANPDVDATSASGHGLRVLAGWLDHVAGLGATGVLLTPIFVSSTHGYDTVDPLRIDQRMGDDQDFESFVRGCHDRGLALILDGVFNHVGRDFGPFRDVVAHGRDSAFADWFHLGPPDPATEAASEGTDRTADGFSYRCFEGHRELVTLNHDHPGVRDWAEAVAVAWLDRGADGWRLDAAYALPTGFTADLVARVRAHHPTAFLFGEVIHGDYARVVADTGLDSVTQYELHKAIWSSLNDANLFELAWALERHAGFVSTFAPVTFVGNHDVTRLASRLADPAHVAPALAVLFTVGGTPCVYYGDELGWTGIKQDRPGGDDAIRPVLPVGAQAEPADPHAAAVLKWHRRLIDLRRSHPWLARAPLEIDVVENRRITYVLRAEGRTLRVAIDVDHTEGHTREGWRSIASGPGFWIGEPA